MTEQTEGFLSTFQAPVDWRIFFANLLLAACLSIALEQFYIRFGRSLSDRRSFGSNFVYLALTTMLVISVVKSSIALSLGLVGALSIVRFRAAIKEPEELVFLFLAIAIGLGAGANQMLLTILAMAVILTVVVAKRGFRPQGSAHPNLFLTIQRNDRDLDINGVLSVLREHCEAADLQRSDERDGFSELGVIVRFNNESQYLASREALKKLDPTLSISFVDISNIS